MPPNDMPTTWVRSICKASSTATAFSGPGDVHNVPGATIEHVGLTQQLVDLTGRDGVKVTHNDRGVGQQQRRIRAAGSDLAQRETRHE